MPEATSPLVRSVLFPGTKIASREMGVLAALGQETVRVKSLKVGVASTGSELVPPGQLPWPGPDL